MKNKIKYILFAMFLSISMLFNMNYIKADSGFDSSFDSGSSWDSGSSYDYDYDYGSSSSSYGSSSSSNVHIDYHFEGFWYLIICFVVIILCNKYMKKNNIKNNTIYTTVLLVLSIVLGNILYSERIFFTISILTYLLLFFAFIPYTIIIDSRRSKSKSYDYFTNNEYQSLNTKELQDELFNVYKDIQLAWAQNNIEPVRNILSDELFNTYQMQIDSMIQMNQRNEMKDIIFRKMVVTNNKVDNNFEELTVTMEVTCRDYMVQMKNGKEVTIRGNEKYINRYFESVRTATKRFDELDKDKEGIRIRDILESKESK